MERLQHHGRETAYRMADGTGAPLLCVHGAGATHEVWRAQLSRRPGRRPVVALDLSGHGESEDVEARPGGETLIAYADDVIAVAEETGARVLVGNSLGGAVCLRIAVDRDFGPDALVLAGTGARLGVNDDLLGWLDDDFGRAIEFLHGPDRLFHTRDGRYLDASREAIRAVGAAVTRRDFLTAEEVDLRDRLGEVEAPTLALTGEHDRLTPPWYHEELAAGIPDCEWTTIEDAAHLSMLERPDPFNDALDEFL